MKSRPRPPHSPADKARHKRDNAFGQEALQGATTEIRNKTFLRKEDEKKHGGYARSSHHDDYFKGVK